MTEERNITQEITMKINPGAPVYVFTFQARNDVDAPTSQLTIEQIEAARNAAAAVLGLVGATVDATSSVLQIDAPSEDARLVLTPTVQTLAEIAQAQADAQAEAAAEATTLEAARAQARAEAEELAAKAEEEEPTVEIIEEPTEPVEE